MARIAGVDIPATSELKSPSPTSTESDPTRAKTILAQTGVNPDTRVKDLEDADMQKLREATDDYTVRR